jgi:hypothetical protein
LLRQLGVITFATFVAVGAAIGTGLNRHALAAHVTDTQCFVDASSGNQSCFTIDGAQNTTDTPSGIESVTFEGTESFTVTSPGGVLLASETDAFRYHALYKLRGTVVLQESGQHSTETLTDALGTCTFVIDFHLAQGNVQLDRTSRTGTC